MKVLSMIVILSLLFAPVVGIMVGEILVDDGNCNNSNCVPNDEIPPESTIKSTPTIVIWPENIYSRPTITVNWHGVDNPGGSGIKWYDVQCIKYYIGANYHTMELPYWSDWEMNTTNTSAQFPAELDYAYYLRVRATDNMGNVEDWSLFYATTIIKGVPGWVCEEIAEGIQERVEELPIPEHYRKKLPTIPPLEDDNTAPVSRVEPLFPLHFWIHPRCWPADMDIVTIMVYPYPPAYYVYAWLEEKGVFSEVYDYASIGLSWIGYDGENGSGIKSYDVQYRQPHVEYYRIMKIDQPIPSGVNTEWLDIATDTTENNTIFYTYYTGLYQFRCRAEDNAGNIEEYPAKADTSVYIIDLRTTDTY